ncbi:hypothetical protein KS2013_907 [Kangiella sediminilitoris]|uniref:GlyGly-CTERM sorting domain-containing protein n=2 Tax=Kangiella sediminilitoris TaxID=1144748 RepID=A0A1B3B9Z8_9GAMM|nr:hypothetical protein KS2013_907 [Kangiella sediminilitoris]
MQKATTKFSAISAAVLLGLLGSTALNANDLAAEQTVATEVSSKATTAIAKRAKTTTVVNSKVDTQPLKGEPVSLQRQNTYISQKSDANLEEELKAFQALDLKAVPNKTRAEMKKLREDNGLPKSSNSTSKAAMGHLYLYDASVLLYGDDDGDGYYSQLRVDFDADAADDYYYDVYAELFIRRIGESQWTHYYTTDVFEIHYDDSSDEYSVTTRLNTGFPPDEYEVLIDLFEYGYSDIVDTLGPFDDYDLTNLYLEDKTYESIGGGSDTYVDNVKTEIFTDADGDGFYREFTLTFDIDTESTADRDVYVNLYQRRNGGEWYFETESDVFTVYGYSSEDAYEISGNWQSGYPTGYYDFRLEVIDAATGEVLDDVSPEFSPLLQVPLEDADDDTRTSTSNPPSSTTSSGHGGGGSTSLLTLGLLAVLGAWRRKLKC